MKQKNPLIAGFLGLLPIILAGIPFIVSLLPWDFPVGLSNVGVIILILAFLVGWGWGYVYVGHPLRSMLAFFIGVVITFSVFMVILEGFGVMDTPLDANHLRYHKFTAVFFPVIGIISILAVMGMTTDAVLLAMSDRHLKKQGS